MKTSLKMFCWLIASIVGFAMYIVLYFLVPLVREIESMKYWIVIIGYISIIVFPFSFYNLIKEIRRKKQNNSSQN